MALPPSAVTVVAPAAEVLVLSDLHLTEAWAWQRRSRQPVTIQDMHAVVIGFLDDLARRWQRNPHEHLLVINGDLFDLDGVRRLPATDEDFQAWKRLLDAAGCTGPTIDSLRAGFRDHERIMGPDPSEPKSLWRLWAACQANEPILARLGRLVAESARLVVLRGNHDTELAWPAAGRALAYALEQAYGRFVGQSPDRWPPRRRDRFRQVVVAPSAVRIGSAIYVEHGHRYEPISSVWPDFDPGRPEALRLPLASWYVRTRYSPGQPGVPLPGRLRLAYRTFLERLLAALYPVMLSLVLVLPASVVSRLGQWASEAERFLSRQRLGRTWRPRVRDFLLPAGTYIQWLRRLGAAWLAAQATDVARRWPALRLVLMGHVHWPCRRRLSDRCVFLNVGSWLPRYLPRRSPHGPGVPYTFVRLRRRGPDDWHVDLLRWDPASGRWRRHRV